ncbi:MAG: UDP:flavonoid glycosyltransferase YjiC (YdhE family) [Neolewinella sp.]|jgi:UDP:flavonoid glycosyltransferase YjiC (YdhE family)
MLPTQPGQRTLICILDWGLGHASRSLALAQVLEEAGEKTFFASCGRAKKFIEQERPGTVVYELPAYDVTYPTRSMPLNVALQLPRWLQTIWRERRCSAKLVEELGIDRIVSDNRFGCYVPGTPSIFLTHQLHPITHSRPVSWLYRKYLQRFDGFWVPDYARVEERVSGKLSLADGYFGVEYIGPLSRLRRCGNNPSELQAPGVAADQRKRGIPADPSNLPPPLATLSAPPGLCVMALLSGPEPMRSQLENIVVAQLKTILGNHVLIRGLPGSFSTLPDLPNNIVVHNFADAALLTNLLPAAQHIVCRSGYSTLMDVYAVTEGNKLILVPTPGQTEQIYLAERETQRIGCQWIARQEDLNLQKIY